MGALKVAQNRRYLYFFGVLLSLVLEGFERLLSRTVQAQCKFIKSQLIFSPRNASEKKHPRNNLQRDSNAGRRGEKRERFLCAMPTPRFHFYFT